MTDKGQRQKQIPFGNDRQKGNGKYNCKCNRGSFDCVPVGHFAQDDSHFLNLPMTLVVFGA